jgi:hypothetical protein
VRDDLVGHVPSSLTDVHDPVVERANGAVEPLSDSAGRVRRAR